MIIKIEFPLPFYVPIEEGLKIVTDYKDFAAFKFECEKYRNESTKANSELEEFCTLIKLDFMPNNDLTDKDSDELLRYSVKNSIIYLNNFIDAFRLINDLNFVRNFSITDLPPIINIEIDNKSFAYVTIPTTILNDADLSGNDKISKALNRIHAWDRHQYFEVIDKFQSKAIHHLYTEGFLFAIVELQTSFESYIRLCHNLILIKNGADDDKIEASKEYPLKNTIQYHIGRALDANFDFKTIQVIKDWNDKLYLLRNKIVHSGLSYISGDEAYQAFDAYENVINHITKLMVEKGFMEENGKVNIQKLNKNTSEHVDSDKVIEKLKQKGFI